MMGTESTNTTKRSAPVKIGTAEQFECVLSILRAASFTEGTICQAFNLDDMSDVGRLRNADVDRSTLSPQLRILIRLFIVLGLVPYSEVQRAFKKDGIDSFLALGLLGQGEFGENYYAQVLLYPVHGFFIASDREINPDGSPCEALPDQVFPAIYLGTLEFLRLLPQVDGSEALDLCAGTGIAAFDLSRSSRRACSTDVTERATKFAEFNRVLNGRVNVEVRQGDLYGACRGETFDCIVAHPPYVPSVSIETIWRDGGAIGDQLVKRIVEGFPQHLRSGGYALILAQGVDTVDGKFEERARQWLGDHGNEFDIIFASENERSPAKVLELLMKKTRREVIEELHEEFDRAGVTSMPYGALFMRRVFPSSDRTPWTVRTRLSSATTGADVQETFRLHDRVSRPEFAAELLQAKPRLAPHLEVKVTYVVHEGSLAPAEYIFETDKPFQLRVKFDDWTIPLFMRFDGSNSVGDVYESARSLGELPDAFKSEDLVLLVTRAIEAGFLLPG
jgi:SAM-dependent methyltransferase